MKAQTGNLAAAVEQISTLYKAHAPVTLLEIAISSTTQNIHFYLSHCSAVSHGLNSYLVVQQTG